MVRRILSETSPFVQLLFLLFLSLLTFLIITFSGTLLAVPLFHIKLSQINELAGHLDEPATVGILKYLQFLQSLSLFLIPSLLFLFLTRDRWSRFIGLSSTGGWVAMTLVILIMIFLIPVNNVLAGWNSKLHLPQSLSGLEDMMRRMEDNAAQLTQAFLKMNSFGAFLINLAIVAVLPALSEELMFRGAIQPIFIKWTRNVHAGILITAFLFSFFHFQFFGLIPRWVLGVIFGYLFYWSKTIWLPVLAHFINNGLAVTVYYIYGSQVVEQKVDTIGTADDWSLAVVGFVLVGTLLYLLRRELDEQKKRRTDRFFYKD
ncbi:MAG: CPBP family intramembrane metalloprotease [Chlorobi bacterium]|nr:CPBP family intramembrane metalloprotease [Chlorobiota bacterium]